MNILIIEDEPFAQSELKRLLSKTSYEINVLDCIDSIEESIEWLEDNPKPDLIFLDIQLSDGLSFEIFKNIDVTSPVIFTTAYDEYAIKAFSLNSIDYLLKPIKQEMLQNALDKLSKLKEELGETQKIDFSSIEQLLGQNKPQEYKTRFVAKVGDQIKHIDICNVAYFFAEDKEVFIVCEDNKRYIIDYTLEQLDKLLQPKNFFRITRNYIANIKSIKKVSKFFNSRLIIELTPSVEEQVIVSRAKVHSFVEWLDN